MQERQREEDLLDERELFGGPVGERLERERLGTRVSRVHARRAAKNVSRALVEKNDEREPPARARPPFDEPAVDGGFDGLRKALDDLPVERVAASKPAQDLRHQRRLVGRRGSEPELEDVLGRHIGHGGERTSTVSRVPACRWARRESLPNRIAREQPADSSPHSLRVHVSCVHGARS
jgi:hypothetical protein